MSLEDEYQQSMLKCQQQMINAMSCILNESNNDSKFKENMQNEICLQILTYFGKYTSMLDEQRRIVGEKLLDAHDKRLMKLKLLYCLCLNNFNIIGSNTNITSAAMFDVNVYNTIINTNGNKFVWKSDLNMIDEIYHQTTKSKQFVIIKLNQIYLKYIEQLSHDFVDYQRYLFSYSEWYLENTGTNVNTNTYKLTNNGDVHAYGVIKQQYVKEEHVNFPKININVNLKNNDTDHVSMSILDIQNKHSSSVTTGCGGGSETNVHNTNQKSRFGTLVPSIQLYGSDKNTNKIDVKNVNTVNRYQYVVNCQNSVTNPNPFWDALFPYSNACETEIQKKRQMIDRETAQLIERINLNHGNIRNDYDSMVNTRAGPSYLDRDLLVPLNMLINLQSSIGLNGNDDENDNDNHNHNNSNWNINIGINTNTSTNNNTVPLNISPGVVEFTQSDFCNRSGQMYENIGSSDGGQDHALLSVSTHRNDNYTLNDIMHLMDHQQIGIEATPPRTSSIRQTLKDIADIQYQNATNVVSDSHAQFQCTDSKQYENQDRSRDDNNQHLCFNGYFRQKNFLSHQQSQLQLLQTKHNGCCSTKSQTKSTQSISQSQTIQRNWSTTDENSAVQPITQETNRKTGGGFGVSHHTYYEHKNTITEETKTISETNESDESKVENNHKNRNNTQNKQNRKKRHCRKNNCGKSHVMNNRKRNRNVKGYSSTQRYFRLRNGYFQCKKCQRILKTTSGMISHTKLHLGIKNYLCGYCLRKFSGKTARDRHERVHTGVKPYQCDICQRRFRIKSGLTKHKVTHTKIKNYKCATCHKRYTQSSSLLRHQKKHSHIP